MCVCVTVSHHFGFGLLDAGAMVNRALNWTNVPTQHKCIIQAKMLTRLVDGAQYVGSYKQKNHKPTSSVLSDYYVRLVDLSGLQPRSRIYKLDIFLPRFNMAEIGFFFKLFEKQWFKCLEGSTNSVYK
jgi:hypothetical protein